MCDCDPEPFKNQKMEERALHVSLLSSHSWGGWREGMKVQSFCCYCFFGKCAQRTILEDDGEVVPTICTALPKHCALVWGNSCGLWRHCENIGLLWRLQKKSQIHGNVFVIFYWSETWKIQHSLQSPWADFMFREWRSICAKLKWVYMASIK